MANGLANSNYKWFRFIVRSHKYDWTIEIYSIYNQQKPCLMSFTGRDDVKLYWEATQWCDNYEIKNKPVLTPTGTNGLIEWLTLNA